MLQRVSLCLRAALAVSSIQIIHPSTQARTLYLSEPAYLPVAASKPALVVPGCSKQIAYISCIPLSTVQTQGTVSSAHNTAIRSLGTPGT